MEYKFKNSKIKFKFTKNIKTNKVSLGIHPLDPKRRKIYSFTFKVLSYSNTIFGFAKKKIYEGSYYPGFYIYQIYIFLSFKQYLNSNILK
jgi:hypothetical protein